MVATEVRTIDTHAQTAKNSLIERTRPLVAQYRPVVERLNGFTAHGKEKPPRHTPGDLQEGMQMIWEDWAEKIGLPYVPEVPKLVVTPDELNGYRDAFVELQAKSLQSDNQKERQDSLRDPVIVYIPDFVYQVGHPGHTALNKFQGFFNRNGNETLCIDPQPGWVMMEGSIAAPYRGTAVASQTDPLWKRWESQGEKGGGTKGANVVEYFFASHASAIITGEYFDAKDTYSRLTRGVVSPSYETREIAKACTHADGTVGYWRTNDGSKISPRNPDLDGFPFLGARSVRLLQPAETKLVSFL
jgi:hypothetical protein